MRKTLIIIVSVIVGAIIGTVVLVFGVLPTFEDECAGDECTQTDGPTLVPVPLPTRMPTREKAYKPVLYLYPQEERQLAVTLDVEGELGTVYPAPERQVQTEEGPGPRGPSVPRPTARSLTRVGAPIPPCSGTGRSP